MANQNGFTADDDQVRELLKAQQGWSPQQAIDWANRYWTKPQLPDPVGTPEVPPVPNKDTYTQPIPQTGDPNGPGDQGKNAQTYSSTPGAAPTATTTNQGTQDVLRNSYLERATQPIGVDRNDPNFRQPIDSYAAAQDRTRRRAENEAAERASAMGLGTSGALDLQRRAAQERSGQATGAFESQMLTQELQRQRNEKAEALQQLTGILSADQTRQLQRDLADLDAALKRESIAQTGSLGTADINLRDKLGTGALNVDLIRALLQNQQFLTDAGIRIGDLEGRYSPWIF